MFFRVGFMWLFCFFPGDYSLFEWANGYLYPYYFASKKQGKREWTRDRRCGGRLIIAPQWLAAVRG